MLAEVLLSLSGHPSSLLTTENLNKQNHDDLVSNSNPKPLLRDSLHPSELESLTSLKQLSKRFIRIQTFSKHQLDLSRRQSLRIGGVNVSRSKVKLRGQKQRQGEQGQELEGINNNSNQFNFPSSHLSPLCSTLLSILREYQDLILDLQKTILERRNEGDLKVGRNGFISLNSIKAKVESWVEPLNCLNRLVDELITGPNNNVDTSKKKELTSSEIETASDQWTGGLLLDLLDLKSKTTVGKSKNCMLKLLNSVQRSWSMRLIEWICHGEAIISKDSSNSEFKDFLVEVDSSTMDLEQEGSKLDHCDFHSFSRGTDNRGKTEDQDSSSNINSTGPIYRFKSNALPNSIDSRTSDSILYVGRALSTIRRSSLAASLSSNFSTSSSSSSSYNNNDNSNHNKVLEHMTQKHSEILREIGPCSLSDSTKESNRSNGLTPKVAFSRVIESVREDVSEWIWRNVLTKETVLRALEELGSIFLHRSGVFQLSFLSTLETVVKSKSSLNSKSFIEISDLERVLHRASIGTELEDDPSLDFVKWSMPLEKKLNSNLGDIGKPAKQRGGIGGGQKESIIRFDDLLLQERKRIQLHYITTYPLDLFLTQKDLSTYSRIFSYFSAFRSTHSGLLKSWQSLSKSQKDRRKFTGSGEGGIDKAEEISRSKLLRKAWGVNRLMLWFIDTMMEHLMTDVVDVQYTRLIDQLGGGSNIKSNKVGEDDLLPPSPMIPISTSVNEMPPPSSTIPMRSQTSTSSLRKNPFITSSSPTKGNIELPNLASKRQSMTSSAVSSTTIGGSSTFNRGTGRVANSTYSAKDGQSVFGGSSATIRTNNPTRSIFGGVGAPSLKSRGFRNSNTPPTLAGTANGNSNSNPNGNGNGSLDFASLRLIHSSFLSFLLDGTLLSSNVASDQIRKILETCQGFTGKLMGKYEGDVLPKLLGEGKLIDREEFIGEVSKTLDNQLKDFFNLLSSATSPLNRSGSTSSYTVGGSDSQAAAADVSLSNMSFSLPLPHKSGQNQNDKERDRMNEVRLEADVAARRHLEQLLLRLDYNRHFEIEAEKKESQDQG